MSHLSDNDRLQTIPGAAVKLGLVPSYSCFNKRVLVRPSEVLAAMAAGREGQA